MTRNRELDLEDIYGCDHEPEIAIAEGSEIVAWACRCGKIRQTIDPWGKAVEIQPQDATGPTEYLEVQPQDANGTTEALMIQPQTPKKP